MKNRGFTLMELLIILSIIFIISTLILLAITFITGNMWYKEPDVLRIIKYENPEVEEVILSERHFWKKTVFLVRTSNGEMGEYLLDSNLLFNYKVEKVKN